VAAAFADRGIEVIDADAIAHALTAPGGAGIEPIRRHFGDEFIGASGAMDRDRMRALVFGRPAARTELESILHPLIRAETARRLALARSPYAILMIPLLVEAANGDPMHWRDRYDRILVADCKESTQVARVVARNGFDEEAVRRIMAVRRHEGRRGRPLDVLVEWEGEDSDGDLWEESWVSVTYLSKDLRDEARKLEGELFGARGAHQAPSRRVSRRAARRDEVRQRQERERERMQWSARLRDRARRAPV